MFPFQYLIPGVEPQNGQLNNSLDFDGETGGGAVFLALSAGWICRLGILFWCIPFFTFRGLSQYLDRQRGHLTGGFSLLGNQLAPHLLHVSCFISTPRLDLLDQQKVSRTPGL